MKFPKIKIRRWFVLGSTFSLFSLLSAAVVLPCILSARAHVTTPSIHQVSPSDPRSIAFILIGGSTVFVILVMAIFRWWELSGRSQSPSQPYYIERSEPTLIRPDWCSASCEDKFHHYITGRGFDAADLNTPLILREADLVASSK